jgi:SAM-dependent methyltransferase
MTDRPGNAFHDFERAGWERAADSYAASFGDLTTGTAGPLLDAAGVGPGTKALDVACGPGFVAAAAAARHAAVVGVDFAAAMVAHAARRFPSVAFQLGDAEALPFDDGSFDAVVMNFGMLHLARPDTAIAEAHRVLRRGGRYAFTVWAAPEQAVGFGMVLNAIDRHGRRDVGLPDGPPFFRFSSDAECRRTLESAGFRDVSVRLVPLVWHLSGEDGVFDALSNGGVRTAAVLRAQTPEALSAIRRDVREATRAYAAGDAVRVPMPAVLASGAKT